MISRRTWILSLAASPLVLAACGNGTDPATVAVAVAATEGAVDTSPEQSGRIAVEAVPEIAATVPQEIRDRAAVDGTPEQEQPGVVLTPPGAGGDVHGDPGVEGPPGDRPTPPSPAS